MLLQTSRFGNIEIDENELFLFEYGIPGFKEENKFALIEIEDSPFIYLQSADNGEVSFITVSPFDFFPDYEFKIPDQIRDEMKLEDPEQVRIVNIITIREKLASATVNLCAPIILNTHLRKGLQHILSEGKYSIHQPLFGELESSKGVE